MDNKYGYHCTFKPQLSTSGKIPKSENIKNLTLKVADYLERQKMAQREKQEKLNYDEYIKKAKLPVFKGKGYLKKHLDR